MIESLTVLARRSGMGRGTPSLAAVERRRLELWLLLVVALTGVGALTAWLSASRDLPDFIEQMPGGTLQAALVVLAFAVVGYFAEKERSLRRLHGALIEERVVGAVYSRRMQQLSAVVGASRRVASVLDVDRALTILLDEAMKVCDAASGAVLFENGSVPEGGPVLRVRCASGGGRHVDETVAMEPGMARAVAEARAAVLVNSGGARVLPRDDGEMTGGRGALVPLVDGDTLVGVIELVALPDRPFTGYQADLLSALAASASPAVATAGRLDRLRRSVFAVRDCWTELRPSLSDADPRLLSRMTSLVAEQAEELGSAMTGPCPPTSEEGASSDPGLLGRCSSTLPA